MRCINCKFFNLGYFGHNPDGSKFIESDKLGGGICLNPKIGSCDVKDSWLETNTQLPPDDGIYASCDEDRASLFVGKNFGCIHFELKL